VGEMIEINIGKKCKAIIIDCVPSSIQVKFWKCNTKHGIFSIYWNNAIVPKHSLGIIIVIDIYIWQGHMRETEIVVL